MISLHKREIAGTRQPEAVADAGARKQSPSILKQEDQVMTTEEILMLIKAGYTKQDIEALSGTNQTQEPAPAPEPTPGPAPELTPEEPESTALEELRKLNENLKEQIKQMQRENVRSKDGGKPERMTAEKVITDFFGK